VVGPIKQTAAGIQMDVELIDARAYAGAKLSVTTNRDCENTKIITLAKAHVKTRTLTIGQWSQGQRQHVSIFSLPSHQQHASYLQTQLKTKNRQDLEQENKFTVLLNLQILPMLLQGLRDTIPERPASRGIQPHLPCNLHPIGRAIARLLVFWFLRASKNHPKLANKSTRNRGKYNCALWVI